MSKTNPKATETARHNEHGCPRSPDGVCAGACEQTQADRNRTLWATTGDAREAAAADGESYWR